MKSLLFVTMLILNPPNNSLEICPDVLIAHKVCYSIFPFNWKLKLAARFNVQKQFNPHSLRIQSEPFPFDTPSSQCQIMARELADPTPALDRIVREAIAPLHEFMGKLVREIVGAGIGEAELRHCVLSIAGQCLLYRHSHPVLQRLHPEMRYDNRAIEAIARHIVDFSLAGGIRHVSGKKPTSEAECPAT